MTFARHQYWTHPNRVQHDLKHAFERFFGAQNADAQPSTSSAQWTPRVDIKEEDQRFVIFADVPGVDTQDIEIAMDKGVLSIKGERKNAAAEEGASFTRVERRQGQFSRRFALPDTADAEGITATGKNGVLEISIPKKPQTSPRRISIS